MKRQEKADGTRQCAFTRRRSPKEALLRLQLDPDGNVIVDLYCKAGGRGIYVAPSALARALETKALYRIFKGKAKALTDVEANALIADTDRRLSARLGELVGLSRRTGDLALGAEAVRRALANQQHRPLVVVTADDISERSSLRVREQVEHADQVFLVSGTTKEMLGKALGRDLVSVVAVWHRTLGLKLRDEAVRLAELRKTERKMNNGNS